MPHPVRQHGFTLIEVLVSCLILAVGAVVVCGLAGQCLTNTVYGMQYGQACRLLDETLDKVAASNMDELAKRDLIEGAFDGRFPEFRYRIAIKREGGLGLYRVHATVFWQDGPTYRVEAETLFYDLGGTRP